MPATTEVPKKDKKNRKKRRKPLPPLTHSLRDVGLSVPALPRDAAQKRPTTRNNSIDRGNSASPCKEHSSMADPTPTPVVQPVTPVTPTPNNGGAAVAPAPAPAPPVDDKSVEMAMVQQAGALLGQLGQVINAEPPPKKFDYVGVLEFGAKLGMGGVVLIGVTAALAGIASAFGGDDAPTVIE